MSTADLLYTEVDDSCALCGARERLTIHHIDGNHGNSAYDNQIVICEPCHVRHHKGEQPDQERIETRKRHLISKTLTVFGVSALKIADRKGGVVSLPFLLYHLVGLGLMSKEETQMEYGDLEATARFAITESGRDLVKKWL